MTTYKTAYPVLTAAIWDPADPTKLHAAKSHPILRKTFREFTKADFEVLQKVFAAKERKKTASPSATAGLPGDPFYKRRRAYRALIAAIEDPAHPGKLQAVKSDPILGGTVREFGKADFEVLQKVFSAE